MNPRGHTDKTLCPLLFACREGRAQVHLIRQQVVVCMLAKLVVRPLLSLLRPIPSPLVYAAQSALSVPVNDRVSAAEAAAQALGEAVNYTIWQICRFKTVAPNGALVKASYSCADALHRGDSPMLQLALPRPPRRLCRAAQCQRSLKVPEA